MSIKVAIFSMIFVVLFSIDQLVKFGFAHYDWDVYGPVMSLQLAYNNGVAFSMFAFLGPYLKYIQLTFILGICIYLYKNKDVASSYYIPLALIFAGGLSNILDRFTYGAVVDYFYWHYMFDFAIFNFADVLIDFGVVLIIYKQIMEARREKKQNKI